MKCFDLVAAFPGRNRSCSFLERFLLWSCCFMKCVFGERFWFFLGLTMFGAAFFVCVSAGIGFGLGFHNMDLAYNKALESGSGFGDWYDRVSLDESLSLSDLYIVGAGMVLRNFWWGVGSSFVFGFLFCLVIGLVWEYRFGRKRK